MANEYKLSYTAQEIDERLGRVATPNWEQDSPDGMGYIDNRPFYENSSQVVAIEIDTSKNYNSIFGLQKGKKYTLIINFNDGSKIESEVECLINPQELSGGFGFIFHHYFDERYTNANTDNNITIFVVDNYTMDGNDNPIFTEGQSFISAYNILKDTTLPYKTMTSAKLVLRPVELKKLNTKFINTTSEISENSNDNDLVSAKAVYEAIQKALYIDKEDVW